MRAELRRMVIFALCAGLIGFLMVRFVVQRVDVYGDSMEPSYSAGDILLAEKLSVHFVELKRFEPVVFRYEYRENQYYIKRIIGLPGETVQIIEGQVWIDGIRLEDPYGTEQMENPGRASEPVLLGEEEYFVLGDNRNDSSDSRDSDIGDVRRDRIIGRVGIRIWQEKKEQTYEENE